VPRTLKKSFKIFSIFFLLIVFTLISVSCKEQGKSKSPSDLPNIIVIVPDAMRAKQLPCYGYQHIRTPNIDALAKDATLFKHALVRVPVTQPSFSNFFSGLMLPMNCLRWGEKTMAEYMKETGYETFGVVSSRVLSTWAPQWQGKKQFDRGFDEYIQEPVLEKKPYTRKNEETTHDILKWLEKHAQQEKPFFLFAHYIDPHGPWEPGYDQEIVKIDHELGRIIQKLKDIQLYKKSLIIFTSDHGESLGDPVEDHGSFIGHGWFTYLEQTQVPLLIKFPDNQYIGTVGQITRNYDILPTLLDFLGAPYDKEKLDGVSLMPAIRDGKDLELISYHNARWTRLCPGNSVSAVYKYNDSLYQFIKGEFSDSPYELYDIVRDPGEHKNLVYDPQYKKASTRGYRLATAFNVKNRLYKKKLHEWERKRKGEKGLADQQKEIEVLKTLGYLEGGAPSQEETSGKFLMKKNLTGIGKMSYCGIIRQPQWGLLKKDPYFPKKILYETNSRIYILANRNQELFEYSQQNGLVSLKIDNVIDMVLDKKNSKLVILQEKGLFTLDLKLKSFTPLKSEFLQSHMPINGIYLDDYSNLYLFKKKMIYKLDPAGNLLKEYRFLLPVPSTKNFVVYKENFIYASKNKLVKFNPMGILLKKIQLKEGLEEISSLTLDDQGRLWVLMKNVPGITVLDQNFEKIASFTYNNYEIKMKGKGWNPTPTKYLWVNDNKIFIIDNWEGILEYKLQGTWGETNTGN
jgi:arylsulfatase